MPGNALTNLLENINPKILESERKKLFNVDPKFYNITHGLIFMAYLHVKHIAIDDPKLKLAKNDTVLDVINKFMLAQLYKQPIGWYKTYKYEYEDDLNPVLLHVKVPLYLSGYSTTMGEYIYSLIYAVVTQYATENPNSDVARKLALPFSFEIEKIIGIINLKDIFDDFLENQILNYLGKLDFYKGLILLHPQNQNEILDFFDKNHQMWSSSVSELVHILDKQLPYFNKILYPKEKLTPSSKDEVKYPASKKAKRVSALMKEQSSPIFSKVENEHFLKTQIIEEIVPSLLPYS